MWYRHNLEIWVFVLSGIFSAFLLLPSSSEWARQNWGGVCRPLIEHRLHQRLGADWRGRLVRSRSSDWESCLFYQRHSSHTAADWPSTVMKDVIFMQQWLLHAIAPPPPAPLQLCSVIAHLASVSLPTFLLSRCALSPNWCLSLQDRGSGHL